MSVTNYRIAMLGLVDVDAQGALVAASYKGARRHDFRILPDAGNDSTTGTPALQAYLERELDAGRDLVYMDSRVIVTGIRFTQKALDPGAKTFTNANQDEAIVDVDIPCRGVMVRAHPSNADTIWVGIGKAEKDKGIPLDFTDPPIILPVCNVKMVHGLAEMPADKLVFQPG